MGFLQSILFGGCRIKDASGKRVKPYDQFLQVSAEPPIPPAVFASVRAECDNYELTQSQRGLQALFVILGIWQGGMLVLNSLSTATPIRDGVIGVLLTLVFWGAAWGVGKLVRASPAVYGNELLAHARCAGCGYALEPAPAPTTTCPECGACWMSEKIGQAIPITPPDADAR